MAARELLFFAGKRGFTIDRRRIKSDMRRNRVLFPQNRRSPRQIGDFCLLDGAASIGLRGIQPVNCGFGVMSDVQPGFGGLGADVLRVGFIRLLMKSVVG